MKKINEEFLKEYIATHTLGYDNDYNLINLFRMFVAFSVHNFEELKAAPNRYANFLLENANLIIVGGKHTKEELPKMIESARLHLIKKIQLSSSKPQKDFVEIVSELSPNKKSSHILDVGAGIIPYSSILFGEQFEHSSTMDRRFFLDKQTLENMNVTPYDQFFDANTPVDKFDIVVGKAPCSAIEHIVRNCAAAGKPYFIELCDCNIPNKKPYIADWYGWQSVLPEIDEFVRFYTAQSTFAYNIDATDEQVKKVIDSHIPPKIVYNQTSFPVKRYSASSSLWLKDDVVYEPDHSDWQKPTAEKRPQPKPDDSEFLQMEIFERS